MKIVQVSQSLSYGDGVTNCILALEDVVARSGYDSVIAAKYVDPRLSQKKVIQFSRIEDIDLEKEDIIIYHLSIGTALNEAMERLSFKKILVYHNVTPARFFRGIDENIMLACLRGILDAESAVGNYLKCISMSEFSKQDLIKYGWNDKDIDVIPLISEYQRKDDEKCDIAIMEKYADNLQNFMFVGRIVPHKKIEDVIRIFAYYQKNVYSECRLFLIGGIGYKNYYNALTGYIAELGVQNVVLTDRVTNAELEAYFSISDMFLCMSEHEGFCMPLIEAMDKGVPVLAYAAAAVPETMGDAGILVHNKDEEEICRYIDRVFKNGQYRERIIEKEKIRVGQVSINNNQRKIISIINNVANTKEYSYKSGREVLRIAPEKEELNLWENLKGLIPIDAGVPIVIYGMGKMGQMLFQKLYDGGCRQIAAICDNNPQADIYCGIPVLKHEECLARHKNAIYIVTVQKQHVCIIADLLESGIDAKNIVFWGNKKGFYI